MADTANVVSKNISIEPKVDDNIVLVANITYPQVEIEGNKIASNMINKHMEQKALDFLEYINSILLKNATAEYMQSVLEETEFVPFQIYQNYVITYNKSPYLSFLTKINAYVGKDDNIKTAYTDSFNTITGKQVSLDDVVSGASFETKIFKEIANQIKKDPEDFYPNYEELIEKGFDNSNFYISKDGIAVYYNKGYISPKENGEPVFIIPYSVLKLK